MESLWHRAAGDGNLVTVNTMTLKEFLDTRIQSAALDRDDWLERLRELLSDIRCWLSDYPQLQLEDWVVLLIDGDGTRFNAPALTILFQDAQITVQPKGAGGRVEMSCGARTVYLEYRQGHGWGYFWEEQSEAIKPLDKTVFADEVVQGLLA